MKDLGFPFVVKSKKKALSVLKFFYVQKVRFESKFFEGRASLRREGQVMDNRIDHNRKYFVITCSRKGRKENYYFRHLKSLNVSRR